MSNIIDSSYFDIYEQLKMHAKLSRAYKNISNIQDRFSSNSTQQYFSNPFWPMNHDTPN